MKFGLCTGPENLELAKNLGFDYIECTVTSIEAMSDSDFSALQSKISESPIKAERFNVLFPGTISLVGPEADKNRITAYLEKAFPRVKALGGTAVVFGSGRSRAFPADMPYRDAFFQLIEATRLIGQIAAKHDLVIVIEPLNKGETNCINSVREGAMLEAAVNLPSVRLLADLYHILKEDEPLENILSVKNLGHTHIAILEGRAFPTVRSNEVQAFFEVLRKINYSGTMSIEGKAADLEADAVAALKVLRSLI
jgi:sugar phosphate isomerase/epimerase